MNQLITYLKKYKDKSFKEMAFNEVDSLIYSTLSYIDFRGIITKATTIKEAYDLYQKKFMIKDKDRFMRQNEELFKVLSQTPRFCDNIILKYENISNAKTQFSALTIKVPHEFKYIAFTGTDDELTSWEEDFRMSFEYPVMAQTSALKYLEKEVKFSDILVYVGGHSKGGNLACYAAMNAKFSTRLRIKYVFDFDGPGFWQDIADSKIYKRIIKKVRHYYPEESIVGMMLTSNGPKKIVKSNASRVNQHNPHSWQVNLEQFDYGELSAYAKGIHKKFERIINEISVEKLEAITNTLFNLLYKAGYTDKKELTKLNFIKFHNIIKEAINLSDEDKSLIYELLKIFSNEPVATKETTK